MRHENTPTLQKQVGCFNHRVVTLVADKLERQRLLEVCFDVEDYNLSSLELHIICEGVSSTAFQRYISFHGLHGYKQAHMFRYSVFTTVGSCYKWLGPASFLVVYTLAS